METKTTDNKVAVTAVVSLAAALALLTVKMLEKGFEIHLNGESPIVMGSITVVYHACLSYLGVNDVEVDK